MRTMLILGGLGLLAVPVHSVPGTDELKNLQGSWESVSIVDEGKVLGKDQQVKFVVQGDKLTYPGDHYHQIKIDGDKKPKHLDLVEVTGAKKGLVYQGIFVIENDELKFCLDKTGKSRPTAFESTAGSGQRLMVFKR